MDPHARPDLHRAKVALIEGRERLGRQHERGSPGVQVCAKLTDLADGVITAIFRTALEDLARIDPALYGTLADDVALVAHGGYGRRELAPYSDIDLMLLHTPEAHVRVSALAGRMVRDIFDVGLDLGQSVRTPRQAVSLAIKDPLILTSVSESRHLTGCEELTDRFLTRLKTTAARRAKSLLPAIDDARRAERQQYGETVYLLEPNIKKSRGGLRDVQLMRWIGFCCYGTTDLDGLYLAGALQKDEQQALRAATEFLLCTRNEVHFHSGQANDRIHRAEQVRLAEWLGYENRGGLRPVERFMRDYFRHTRTVRYISSRFLANAYRSSRVAGIFSALASHRVDRNYRVGLYRIAATRHGLKQLKTDLTEVLRLAELANLYDRRIAHDTWEAIRNSSAVTSGPITEATAARFWSLLAHPPQLARLLRRLHEMGVLERLIPAFHRARGLLQFNEYHKYTVDEHCLRAVERATEFANDPGPLGHVYRSIEGKQTLHLALLIHDLGKGYEEDHSEVGHRIARETAQHLSLPAHETEVLEFLVHKHLLMSHWALWRDINDPATALTLAVEVGSPEVLRMLYVLTAADLAAVGPGVLNDWKTELLTQLYERTLEHLTGEQPATSTHQWQAERRAAVAEALTDTTDASWYQEQIAALPVAYLRGTPPEDIAGTLQRLHTLNSNDVTAWSQYNEDHDVLEFSVGGRLTKTQGIFHKLTGALSGEGVQILSAQINTLGHGLLLDRFHVVDPDFRGRPPDERVQRICDRLVEVLSQDEPPAPTFRRIWSDDRAEAAALSDLPTRVSCDNVTSDAATILQVFAPDGTGLLYTIARTLDTLGLSVVAAKIGTHLDQVVDVFYVTDSDGKKIEAPDRLKTIRRQLVEAIESFEAN